MFESLPQEDVGSFLYLSVPYYWFREMLLASRSKRWNLVSAIVETTSRSRGGSRQVIRAELWYSYSVLRESYSGHVIRDCGFSYRQVRALVDEHHPGDQITVRVNPDNPAESYFCSGIGWIDPIIASLPALLFLGIIVEIAMLAIGW